MCEPAELKFAVKASEKGATFSNLDVSEKWPMKVD